MDILIPLPLRWSYYLILSVNGHHMWSLDDLTLKAMVILIPCEEDG